MGVNNSFRNAEAQTGAFSNGFCRVKGLHNFIKLDDPHGQKNAVHLQFLQFDQRFSLLYQDFSENRRLQITFLQILLHLFSSHTDDRQWSIDLMGDPAGHLSEG